VRTWINECYCEKYRGLRCRVWERFGKTPVWTCWEQRSSDAVEEMVKFTLPIGTFPSPCPWRGLCGGGGTSSMSLYEHGEKKSPSLFPFKKNKRSDDMMTEDPPRTVH